MFKKGIKKNGNFDQGIASLSLSLILLKMKLVAVAAVLSTVVPFTLADFLPALQSSAPDASHVKARIAPPADATLYDVYFARGNRIYQCNPEKTGFQHWYNVQTHAFLYPTKGESFPYDREGKEIGQLSAAPLNPKQQMANPMDTTPIIYNYQDGSWAGTARPLSTTTKEEGRAERGDSKHLDDHLTPVVKSSTDGYLSHAKYIVRLNSYEGVVPAAETCTKKGLLVNKPFTAYFMFYTDNKGVEQLAAEKVKWEEMVENFTPEKLALASKKENSPVEAGKAAGAEVVAESAPEKVVESVPEVVAETENKAEAV
ncbi:unnamed protein product [Mucor hiemalis]